MAACAGGCASAYVNRIAFYNEASETGARRLAEDWKRHGGVVLVCRGGRSMRPGINEGDLLLVRRYGGERLLEGQIATYENPDTPSGLTTHRVHGDNGREVNFCGDANRFGDGWIDRARIRYVVEYVVTFPRTSVAPIDLEPVQPDRDEAAQDRATAGTSR